MVVRCRTPEARATITLYHGPGRAHGRGRFAARPALDFPARVAQAVRRMAPEGFRQLVRHRLGRERGRIDKEAPYTVALVYPSPYRVAMSSLGYQWIYRAIQAEPAMACERVVLPDDAGRGPLSGPARSYEQLRPLSGFPVLALSVASELELGGIVQLLEAAGIPALGSLRDGRHPLVIAGGPLTFSNPLPLGAFADAVVLGEADALAVEVLRLLRDTADRGRALAALARLEHVFVPAHHGDALPRVARADDALLPACSSIVTPEAELSDMNLIEAERGCARLCTYCVMRRSTNGGMRVVPAARLLALVPPGARRVGLVGAAVSDHPDIVGIVRALVERGAEVGLSSLRPDRLSDELVAALAAAGHRTLTTAIDGVSERVRTTLGRRVRTDDLLRAAERARTHRMARLKLYLMLGAPGETEADVDEGVAFIGELSRIVPVALAIAAFCAKRNTPLDGAPFAGIELLDHRLARLRRGLRGRAGVRSTSVRWAWVEHVLARGGGAEGEAVRQAVLAGGSFAAFRRAFQTLPGSSTGAGRDARR